MGSFGLWVKNDFEWWMNVWSFQFSKLPLSGILAEFSFISNDGTSFVISLVVRSLCVFVLCVRSLAPVLFFSCVLSLYYLIYWKLMLALTWIPWGFEYISILKWRKNLLIILHIDHNIDIFDCLAIQSKSVNKFCFCFFLSQFNCLERVYNVSYKHIYKLTHKISSKFNTDQIFLWTRLQKSFSLSNRSIVVFQAFSFFFS